MRRVKKAGLIISIMLAVSPVSCSWAAKGVEVSPKKETHIAVGRDAYNVVLFEENSIVGLSLAVSGLLAFGWGTAGHNRKKYTRALAACIEGVETMGRLSMVKFHICEASKEYKVQKFLDREVQKRTK